MPLRDHFAPRPTWEPLLGGWPAIIVMDLFRRTPDNLQCHPKIETTRYASDFTVVTAGEYEVNVTDLHDGKLVAVIELVSPSNKDRPDNRQDFVAKCEAFVNRGVCVTVVDLVTYRDFNLYCDLLTAVGHTDPGMSANPPRTYAATVRKRWLTRRRSKFETWSAPMAVGQPLPMLPVWVGDRDWVPLELEATYEETCQTLRLR